MCSSGTILATILQACSQAIPGVQSIPLRKSLQQNRSEATTRGFPMIFCTSIKSLRKAGLFVIMIMWYCGAQQMVFDLRGRLSIKHKP